MNNMQPANTAISVNPTAAQRFSGLTAKQKIRMGLAIALFVAIGVIGLVMGRQAEWRVLYANLADKDGGAIVAQLTQMNIPYKHAEGGGAILVPADKVYDTRLRLASQGLPKGAVGGFESIDANRFGMTQFQERLAFQRGLEGELTRSIQALSSVQSARVHLALPNQNGFFREQQKPTASVVVGLNAGRTLDRAQLAGIIHLVSSSVPEMNSNSVSVLDDTGKLLSNPPEGGSAAGAGGGADTQQLQIIQQIEQQYTRRILDILEPVVGRGNVKAQVTAELDFTQSESTSESHKPDPPQFVVSKPARAQADKALCLQVCQVLQAINRRRRARPRSMVRRKHYLQPAVPTTVPSVNRRPTTKSTKPSKWSKVAPVWSSG
jgi:flagellar M-ring protein FliF